jgi:hypothetical protein
VTSAQDEWSEGTGIGISYNANPGDIMLENSPETIEFHTISYWHFEEGEGQLAIDDIQRRILWVVESEEDWNEGTIDGVSSSIISNSLTLMAPDIILDPRTIALWTIDVGGGQTVNNMVNSDLDGVFGNSTEEDIHDPIWVEQHEAKVGRYALKFDTEDFVEIPDSPTINFGKDDSFVVEIWFKTTSNNEMRIITKRDDMNTPYSGYTLGLNNGKVFLYLQDDQNNYVMVTTPELYNDGVWHHISAVRNTSKNMVSITMDGAEVVNTIDPTSDLTNQQNLIIGATKSYSYSGLLDDIIIASDQPPYGNYKLGGNYLSRIFDTGSRALWKNISWAPLVTENQTEITIMTRVSNDSVSWSDWSDSYTNFADDEIHHGISRYIQFKAELKTTLTSETPILRDTKITFETLGYEQEVLLRLENPPTISEGQSVTIKASIRNKIGEPMSDSWIAFFVNHVKVDSVLSDADGKASIQINPSRAPYGRQVLQIEAEYGAIKSEETLFVQRAIPEILMKLENQIPFLLVMGIFSVGTISYVYVFQPNRLKVLITNQKKLKQFDKQIAKGDKQLKLIREKIETLEKEKHRIEVEGLRYQRKDEES